MSLRKCDIIMKILDWGMIAYEESLTQQLALVESIIKGQHEESLVFCSHPPVVTLGRAFKSKDQGEVSWKGEVVETSRGGKATYHGPSQLVIYPLINLNQKRESALPAKDLHAYLRLLEQAVVVSLKELNIEAHIKPTPKASPVQLTGVWVGEKKIASLGVAVKRWVTYHGVAINIDSDPDAFTGISPCGFSTEVMTSAEEVLGAKMNRNQVLEVFKSTFKKTFL